MGEMMKNSDWRYIENGMLLPSENGYCDQPSIVVTSNGRWVAVITTGTGREGARGQYVSVQVSDDKGKSWRMIGALEDTTWESSYATVAIAENGRIVVIYNYNLDQLDAAACRMRRVDMGGTLCYRYSDDEGETWSERGIIQMRDFAIDRRYPSFAADGHPFKQFWNVSKPFFVGKDFYCAMTKTFYGSFFAPDHPFHNVEEMVGALLTCQGLAEHTDGVWQTLPDGVDGIAGPEEGGPVCEEYCFVRLSDGTIYSIARTQDGHPSCAISRDDGHHFTPSFYPEYAHGGRVKTCRAANFIWPLGEGKFLYWFHNIYRPGYGHRNPVWCIPLRECLGEDGMTLSFGNPELLFYHRGEYLSISYPDLFKDNGAVYIAETQKQIARIHPIPEEFLGTMFDEKRVAYPSDIPLWSTKRAGPIPFIPLSELDQEVRDDWRNCSKSGFTLMLTTKPMALPTTLLSAYDNMVGGLEVIVTKEGYMQVRIGGINTEVQLRGSINLLDGKAHHLACVLDAKAICAWLVVDGHMDDGGERLACGWRWVPEQMQMVGGCDNPVVSGFVCLGEIYPRAMMNAEVAAAARVQLD